MDVMLQSQELVDPLHNYSELSLLRRTFKGLSSSENPTPGDLQLALEALAMKSSSNLHEQAKMVVDSSSELLRTNCSPVMESAREDQDTLPKVNARPQERRPALGRKRARFSLRPTTSQPELCGGMSLNTDQLQDPEEFFLAFEKIERAEKELRKQRGDLPTDSTQHMLTNKERIRRPGILGRKADYKQRFSLIAADLDETLGSSKELSQVDILSPPNSILNVGTTNECGASQEKQLVGNFGDGDSITEEKSKKDWLLDELLSEDYTKLDGDGALEYLQERLQIKPTKLDKLCLPDVDSVRKRDAGLSLEQLPRQIEASSDIHTVLKRVRNKESAETPQLAVSSTYSPDSPTPPRNPFSSMSMLSKHLDVDRPGNQISLLKDSTHVEGIFKGAFSLPVNTNSESLETNHNEVSFSEKFVSIITGQSPAENNINFDIPFTKDSTRLFDAVDKKSKHNSALDDMVEGMQQVEAPGNEKNPLGSSMVSNNLVADDVYPVDDKIEDSNRPEAVDWEKNVVDGSMKMENASMILNKPVADNFYPGDNNMEDGNHLKAVDKEKNLVESTMMMEDVHPSGVSKLRRDMHHDLMPCPTFTDILGPVDKCHAVAEHSENMAVLSIQNNQGESQQEFPQEPVSKQKGDSHTGRKKQARKHPTGESLNVGSKQRAVGQREMRGISRRKSLLGAGTHWQGGVRRSTRNRVKPLEFWRGEQLIYERVHENLLTVVGCKYASPEKHTEQFSLKV